MTTNLAFEAIARREAHELQLQQKNKNNKRFLEKTRAEDFASTPSKKGKYSFTGQTAARDAEPDHPIYLPLSHPVHEKLAMPNLEVNVMDKMLHELLQNGDIAQNYMQGSRKMKIDNRINLDNKVQEHKMELSKVLQSHSKRSKKHMSMKQHKKIGSLDLPQDHHKFEMFQPMHDMWKDYMAKLLKSVGKSQMLQCILGADLHGAHILVVDCKMAVFKGVSGIMIRETAETFGIITKDNKFKVVLKKISVFMLQVDCWKITLYGDKLTSRKVGQ
ncbi:ribonuclease MRP protein subunit POP4-like [Bidens hawaiensis]|uniref:ribonuclease MRP protein subunit POP4-like n=1 Tax=Bidens hawaiensis TaxID=980011 RepID=UPI00404A33D1